MKTKQALLVQPGRFEWRDVELSPGEDQLLIRVIACGLCNWELNHWQGGLGRCPQTLGHEVVGEIVEMGREVKDFRVGQIVTGLVDTLHGFAERCLLPAGRSYVVTGPRADMALGEPLSCVVTTLCGAAPQAGDVAVVLGCGPMGLWCLQAMAGGLLSALVAVDVADSRLELAKRFGATCAINVRQTDGPRQLREWTDGHMADVVIEGTGRPDTVQDAIKYLRTGRPRLVIMSSHGRPADAFDFRPLMLCGAEVHFTQPAYGYPDVFRRAVAMYNRGTFNVGDLVTHRFSLDQINAAFQTLEHKPEDYIKGIVTPNGHPGDE